MLYTGRHEWWERIKCCQIFSVPTLPILSYYTTLVIDHHSGVPAVLHMAALEFIILGHMNFFVVTEQSAVEYNCRDPRTVMAVEK